MKKFIKKNRVVAGLGMLIVGGVIGTGLFISTSDDNAILKTEAKEITKKVEEVVEEKKDKKVEEVIIVDDVKETKETKEAKEIKETKETVIKEDKKEVAVVKEEKSSVSKEADVKKELPKTTTQAQAQTQPKAKVEVKTEQKVEQKKDVVTTKSTTTTESIPFETVRQNDSGLDKGKEVVSQEGRSGVKTITYNETYVNGHLRSKDAASLSVTQQPVNKIVRVGTKEVTSNASAILTKAGFAVAGSQYSYITELSGVAVTVTLSGDRVSRITFDGTGYYAWKSLPKDLLIMELGQAEGTKEYNAMQQDMRLIESAIRAAAYAAKNASLYNEILKGGASSIGYNKSF